MRKASGKALSALMSIVLAVGLMPVPAYADARPLAAGEPAQAESSATQGSPFSDFDEPFEAMQDEIARSAEEGEPSPDILQAFASDIASKSALYAQSAAGDTLVAPDAQLIESGTFGDNGEFTWKYYDDATLKVSGEGAMPDFTKTSQPWIERQTLIEHVEVCEGITSIGAYSFYGCISMSQVKLPSTTLVRIGDYAFNGDYDNKAPYDTRFLLRSLELPDSLREIGVGAITGPGRCYSYKTRRFDDITYVTIPKLPASLVSLPASAFKYVRFEEGAIPAGLSAVGAGCFSTCIFSERVAIPEVSSSISLFSYCTFDKGVDIPTSVTSVNLSSCTFGTDLVVPGNITEPVLDKVVVNGDLVLSEGVRTLNSDSLNYASAEHLVIPSTLEKTEVSAFYFAQFDSFVVSENNLWFSAREGALCGRERRGTNRGSGGGAASYEDKGAVLIAMPKLGGASSARLPEDVSDIENSALLSLVADSGWNKPPLSIHVPSSLVSNLENVSYGQFTSRIEVAEGNSAYRSVDGVLYDRGCETLLVCPSRYAGVCVMPSTVTSVKDRAFSLCYSVSEVVVSSQLSEIPPSVFLGLSMMKSCYIPASVTSIGSRAFEGCNALTDVYYGGEEGQWDELRASATASNMGNSRLRDPYLRVTCDVGAYGICEDGLLYYLSAEGVLNVRVDDAADGGETRAMRVDDPGDVPWAGLAAQVRELHVGEGVTSICRSAFEGFASLAKVTLPRSMASVEASAFAGCAALADVVCQGDPFECIEAGQAGRPFDASTATIHYLASNESWQRAVSHDADTKVWNGYHVADDASSLLPENVTPAITDASLGSERVHIDGRTACTVSLDVYDERGELMTDSVEVTVEAPAYDVPRQRSRIGVEGLMSDEATYDKEKRAIWVGPCAPAGCYTVTISPIEGVSQGNAKTVCFEAYRDAARVRDQHGSTYITGNAKGKRAGGAGVSYVNWECRALNQYSEDVTDLCDLTVRNETLGKDITDCLGEYNAWFEEGTDASGFPVRYICFGEMAIPGEYSYTLTGREGVISGTVRMGITIKREQSILNVPYAISLSGGDESVEFGECGDSDGIWAAHGYRTRVLDAYDDPCWPKVTWEVADSRGANVTSCFDVDEHGYLLVKKEASGILADGDNTFKVTASTLDTYTNRRISDSAQLTVRKAPAHVELATHKATFMAGREVVGEISFAQGDESLEEPAVPQRENYIGAWEDYDLASAKGDITVNAIYAPVNPDAVSDIKGEVTASYDKSVVTIHLAAAAATRQVKVESQAVKPIDIVMVLDQSGSMADALGSSQTKRDALAECASRFTSQLYDNAVKTGSDHRIALVGFAFSSYNNGKYKNTGLLAGANGAKNYSQLTRADYAGALLSVKDGGRLNPMVTEGINSIAAEGATAADVGLKIAKNVFAENPVAMGNDGTPERERIVVFITDGVPTSWGSTSSLVRETAAEAILMARDIKQGQGARVYSVGVDAEADPSAAFTGEADGVKTDSRGTFQSFDFNRFLHAVSSDYPNASGMGANALGTGAKDGGYYMAANDTSNLSAIFKTILYSTVYAIESFDRARFAYTLPDGIVLTMKQEEEMRSVLAGQGLSDEDIVVVTDENGKTTLTFRNVKVVPETVDGVVRYAARVSFQASVDKDVSGDVAAGEAASMGLGREEVALNVPTISVPAERCLVVFKVNDAVYEIRETKVGDEIEPPDTDLARWMELERRTELGAAKTGEAYAVFETSTLTRSYNVNWVVGERSTVASYSPGAPVAVPDEVIGWVPEGMELTGWSPALPTTMPGRNITCTAVLSPKHVHDYSHAVYQTGSCDTGLVEHHACICGEETEERAVAKAHAYDAVLSSGGMYGTTVEKLVCRDCGHAVGKDVTYKVAYSEAWRSYVLDLSKYENSVEVNGESGDAISLRFYVGDTSDRKYYVTRVDADGAKTTYQTSLTDGYLVFDPDHFSIYVLGGVAGDGATDAGPVKTMMSYADCEKAIAEYEPPVIEGDPEAVSEQDDAGGAEKPGGNTGNSSATSGSAGMNRGNAGASSPKDISKAMLTLEQAQFTYDGKAHEPAATVALDGKALEAGTDYELSYRDNVHAGAATATVTGKGAYIGAASATFSIARAVATVSPDDKAKYAGEADPELTATVTGLVGSDAVEYTLSREAGEQPGTYAITASGEAAQGDYDVQFKVGAFTIRAPSASGAKPVDISDAVIAIEKSSYTYDGSAKEPAVSVKLGTITLSAGTDYTLSYEGNVSAGTATVIVTGRGSYTGEATATFTIAKAANPAKIQAKAKSVSTSKLKKKRQKVAPISVKKAKGKVTYARVAKGSSRKLLFDKKTGKVTVKKGMPVGKYKVRVKVRVSGDTNYKPASKTVSAIVTVK